MDFANLMDLSTNASLLRRVDFLRIDFFTGINDLLAETACSLDLYTANTMPNSGVSTGDPKPRCTGGLAARRRRPECDVSA
jgi:hypothetical protein